MTTSIGPRSRPRGPSGLADVLNGWRRSVARFRIREHLRRTELVLRETDHPHVSDDRLDRRRRTLDRLAAYRERGVFPTNRSHPERTPLFVGDDGTPCAMAHVLEAAGREELVASVLEEDPTVHIEDLPTDHPVVRCIEANGLTRAEAARIQPAYPEGVQFATTCGPVPCWLAGVGATLIGSTAFAVSEWIGYRLARDRFPENPLKRRGVLAYVTGMNLLAASLLALVLFALLP